MSIANTLTKWLVKLLPAGFAASFVRRLATRSLRPPVKGEQELALAQATVLHYGERKVAWVWGEGPVVVLVHGWNGRAAQLAPLAVAVARLGFRCVAIEVTGHGSSPGHRTEWGCFIDDIASLSQTLGQEIHAYVGHSAGALTMMAARALRGIQAERYVCICAPSHPFPPIEVIRQRLNPPSRVIEHCKRLIALQFDASWEQLEAGRSYRGAGADLLLFYDKTDRFVPHGEGDRILAWCPGAQLVKTNVHGHSKILAAPELVQAVGAFLLDRGLPVAGGGSLLQAGVAPGLVPS